MRAAQKGGRMSERAILKILLVYLLVGCFLAGNILCIYASAEDSEYSGSNENGTDSSGYKESENPDNINPDSPEDSEAEISESSETDSSENVYTDDFDGTSTEVPEDTEEYSDYTEADDAETDETEADKTENMGAESPEYTETEVSEDSEIPEYPQTELEQSEVSEYIESEVSEYNDTQVPEYEETETSENVETASEHTHVTHSHYTKTVNNNIKYSEYTQIENNRYIETESSETGPLIESQSKQAPPSASVSLHGEKTEVVSGEDILLKLSAVNLITKPTMHVQVIIIPPSGMMVSSSAFVQSGAGQYTTTYDLEPGQGRDIEVRIESSQVGDFNVEGRVVYYFGDDIKNAEDYTLKLPIKVEAKSYTADIVSEKLPGFGVLSVVSVLMGTFMLKRKIV